MDAKREMFLFCNLMGEGIKRIYRNMAWFEKKRNCFSKTLMGIWEIEEMNESFFLFKNVLWSEIG